MRRVAAVRCTCGRSTIEVIFRCTRFARGFRVRSGRDHLRRGQVAAATIGCGGVAAGVTARSHGRHSLAVGRSGAGSTPAGEMEGCRRRR